MGRVLFGVMGDAWGHISQALAVADALPHHEFLFVGGGRTRSLRQLGYRVMEVPMMRTFYRSHRVDLGRTIWNGLKTLLGRRRIVERVSRLIQDFRPDLILTAYEYFTPLAARRLGVPCLSLDNHHAVTKCACPRPKGQLLSRMLYLLPLRFLYSQADRFLISAFYPLAPLNPADTEVFPPVLRKAVLDTAPIPGDHVVVYQTSPTFHHLVQVLLQMDHTFFIYGFGEREPHRNLVYKGVSQTSFLEDVASCRYVITNGGHNLIAEALYYGKPVFALPIRLAYEQFFNAHMLQSLGYGRFSLEADLEVDVLQRFEACLDQYGSRIAAGEFCGNGKLAARVEQFLSDCT